MMIDEIAQRVECIESRGSWWLESHSGHRGVMQVHPKWAKVPASWLWIPSVNREEGKRLLTWWHTKAKGNWHKTLAGYRCGWDGLHGKCGNEYANQVLNKINVCEE